MQLRIPYVVRYEDRLRYRRVVPPDCREAIGQSNWSKTWKPDTPRDQIAREATNLARQHDAEVARARGEVETAEIAEAERTARRLIGEAEEPADVAMLIDTFSAVEGSDYKKIVNALLHGGVYSRETISLSEALRLDLERHSGDKDPKPFRYAVLSFVGVVGDLDITEIRRADVATWINTERSRGLKPSTVRRRLDSLCALVGRAYRDMDIDRSNPFEKHAIKGGRGSPSDRVPFNRKHLELIDSYLENAPRLHPDTRNMIQLMRYTGGGVAEVAGLAVADISLTNGIPFVWYRPNTLRSLKTAVRERQVPLLGAALTATQDAVKRAGDRVELFEGYGAGGRGGDYVSARLNAALRRAGIPRSSRLTCYSFRHGITEGLRAAGVHPDLARRLMGHSATDIHGKYGATAAQLVELREAMQAAIERLGDIDPSVYSDGERIT